MTNSATDHYIRQFENYYEGENWASDTLMDKINATDEVFAFKQPVPGVHSIAELVWHIVYWRTVLINAVQKNYAYKKETVDSLNFLPVEELKKKGWQRLLDELAASQSDIIKLLSDVREEDLKAEYQPGRSLDYMIQGVIHHDYYHLGQIGIVKKMIEE